MIYFIQDGPEGPIKIGTTIRLSVRLTQLKSEHGPDLTVLAVIDGAYAEERALHERFRGSRLRGEWFVSSPELLDLIQTEGREWDGTDERPSTLVAVWINRRAAEVARQAASLMNKTFAEYLSDVVFEVAQADLVSAAKRIVKEDEPKPKLRR